MDFTYFGPGSVVWDLQSSDKFDAIRETIYRSTVFSSITNLDLDTFSNAVIKREREQSTGFGYGIAIAHGRDPVIHKSQVALGISREGIEFMSYDNQPVHLLFVVANHPEKHVDYLRILSSLAILARNELFRREILTALCSEEAELRMGRAMQGVLARAV